MNLRACFFVPALLLSIACAASAAQMGVGEAVVIQNEVVRVAESAASQINVGDSMLRDEVVRTGANSDS